MKDKLIIDSIEAMRALSDERRLAIVRNLVEAPHTAEELSEAIGQPKSSLYYHLGELEKHELIEVVETMQRRNFLEKVYRATAAFYSFDRALFATQHGREAFQESVHSVLDTTAADIDRLLQEGAIPSEEIAHGYRQIVFGPGEREEFMERFGELLRDYSVEPGGGSEPGVDAHVISYFVYPTEASGES